MYDIARALVFWVGVDLLRVASSAQQIYVLPENVCFPSIDSSVSEVVASFVLLSLLNSFFLFLVLSVFLFLFSDLLACVVVFSYPVRSHFTCLTLT